MLRPKLTVVVSAGQSRNPEKRQLESAVADAAAALPGVAVLQIPHLYDLPRDGQSFQALRQIESDIVVVSWLFSRAAHWVLDRNGVQGRMGEIDLRYGDEDDDDAEGAEEEVEDAAGEQRVLAGRSLPHRQIFALDFRASQDPRDFAGEIKRILDYLVAEEHAAATDPVASHDAPSESAADVSSGSGDSVGRSPGSARPFTFDLLERLETPTNDTYVGSPAPPVLTLFGEDGKAVIDEHPTRRWYPVIDYSRCTNCMECIDFCLFGVYGIDGQETIMVEQADNCRKGCPACSRVCPENAIIFPQHKTPAIAGAPVGSEGLKIDLSKLFGAPESDEDPIAVAARERDEQLLLAGREAVGMKVGIRQRIDAKKAAAGDAATSDELDNLLDQLDALDL
ncbi:MAG: ferredoxin family protein [Planctomycetota bacterium]|nr:MAG: ferredoxin family protein [Planctomycetota bacterium]